MSGEKMNDINQIASRCHNGLFIPNEADIGILESRIIDAIEDAKDTLCEEKDKEISHLKERLSFADVDYKRQDNKIKELQAEVDDWRNTQNSVMSEKCPTDEVHCTCVPMLKAEVEKLKLSIAILESPKDDREARHILKITELQSGIERLQKMDNISDCLKAHAEIIELQDSLEVCVQGLKRIERDHLEADKVYAQVSSTLAHPLIVKFVGEMDL